jgi:hypothetical protein
MKWHRLFDWLVREYPNTVIWFVSVIWITFVIALLARRQ